jgi:hypothetical protein
VSKQEAELRELVVRTCYGKYDTYAELSPFEQEGIDKLVQLFAQQKAALLKRLEEKGPEDRQLVEPVTKREVKTVGDKVGIDLDADLKGSLTFIQNNGFNQANTLWRTALKEIGES